jgi:hypothetical protein
MTEETFITCGRGKWSQEGVPHHGWHCVDIEDLEEPNALCQMCETQEIRYVHHMEHPDYPEPLAVGCICAGHMEENYTAARARESAMKQRAGKRQRWLTRKWRTSAKGNPWIRVDGVRVAIYPRGNGWAATVASHEPELLRHSRVNYPTVALAKLAAFDFLTHLGIR